MTKDTRKNGGNTGRNPDGTFGPGNAGKPRGARHKATRAALELLDGEAEALSRKAVEMALAGDTTALRLCLERVAPPRKDAPVRVELPKIQSGADSAAAISEIIGAVASGQLTPAEGSAMTVLIEAYRRTLEITELEARLAAMEEQMEQNS